MTTNHTPTGHRVIVRPDRLEDTDATYKKASAAGIVFAETDTLKREKSAVVYGTLVAVGFQAWKDFSNGEPWAKVGDKVMFARYTGSSFHKGDDLFLVLNDQDILAVVEGVE